MTIKQLKPRMWVFIDDSKTKMNQDMAMYLATTNPEYQIYINKIIKKLKNFKNSNGLRKFIQKPKYTNRKYLTESQIRKVEGVLQEVLELETTIEHGYVINNKYKENHLNYVESIFQIVTRIKERFESSYEIVFDFSSNKIADKKIIEKLKSKNTQIYSGSDDDYTGLRILDLLRIKLTV